MKIKITRQGLAGDGKSAYYSDHTTPLPIGEWDVELKTQAQGLSYTDWFLVSDDDIDFINEEGYATRQIYISLLPSAQSIKESVAQQLGVDDNMPEIANHIYTKTPDLNDIEWAKNKVKARPVKAVEEEKEWIEITDTNLPHDLLICEWRYKENKYKTEQGNLVPYNDPKGIFLGWFIYPVDGSADICLDDFSHYRKPSPHPIETPAIATSEGVEGAAERLFPFHPQDDEQDVERCKDRRNGFEVGAEYMKQHILTTHVPVDEVEKIISQYPGLFRNTSCRLSLLEEIKSLKSKTVL